MRCSWKLTFAMWLLILSVPAFARLADGSHIPDHNPSDPTFPIPLPGQDFFSGGYLAGTFIGPVGNTVITGTTFEITYVSDGVTPASDMEIFISIPTSQSQSAELHVTGADLGFGNGAGTFSGSFHTDALNQETCRVDGDSLAAEGLPDV